MFIFKLFFFGKIKGKDICRYQEKNRQKKKMSFLAQSSSSPFTSNSSKVSSSRWSREVSTPLEERSGSIGPTFSTISNKQPLSSSISKQNEESLLQSTEQHQQIPPQKVSLDGDDNSMTDTISDVSHK